METESVLEKVIYHYDDTRRNKDNGYLARQGYVHVFIFNDKSLKNLVVDILTESNVDFFKIEYSSPESFTELRVKSEEHAVFIKMIN